MPAKRPARAYAVVLNNQINVTPFVDVMLVLLIVMMIAAPMATVSLKLDSPPPCTTNCPRHANPILISLSPGGALFLSSEGDSRPTSQAALRADLAAFIGGAHPTDAQIVLRADRSVRYGGFFEVMNVLHLAGYNHVSLLNENLG